MSKAILRRLMSASVVVCLLILAVGCSKMGDGTTSRGGSDTTGTYGTNQGGAMGKDQGMQTGSSSTTDATALAKLMSADSSEIAVAKYALERISDSRVKDFAQMLIDDHAKDQDQVKSLASSQNITPMLPSGDSNSMHMDHAMSMLQSADKGQSFDSAFLQMMINDHQTNIDALKTMQSMVSNDKIKSHINDFLPTLQKHLDQAQTLVKNLGMPQTGH